MGAECQRWQKVMRGGGQFDEPTEGEDFTAHVTDCDACSEVLEEVLSKAPVLPVEVRTLVADLLPPEWWRN